MDLLEQAEAIYDEYTSSPSKFPWKWYGDIPKYGKAHSYLCSILAKYMAHPYRSFAEGWPTFREMQNVKSRMDSESSDVLFAEIVRYCNRVYARDWQERESVEKDVFEFLVDQSCIREDLKSRIYKDLGIKNP